MAGIQIVKVVREFHEVEPAPAAGNTFGAFVDEYIAAALESGDELQDVTVHFSPEDWQGMREQWHVGRTPSADRAQNVSNAKSKKAY